MAFEERAVGDSRATAVTITLSDSGAAGQRKDESGPLLGQLLTAAGVHVVKHELMPDSQAELARRFLDLSGTVDLIVTTGGTGLGPRDFTPEATLEVIEKRVHGIEQALHLAGREKVPTSILSRAVVGVRGQCLIVNLPGSPGGVRDGMAVLAPVLHHAVGLLRGQVRDCQK